MQIWDGIWFSLIRKADSIDVSLALSQMEQNDPKGTSTPIIL